MMTDLVAAANCFSEILPHRDIKTIRKWKIEYAPNTIQDRTAFDVYVEYETFKTRTGCKYRASTISGSSVRMSAVPIHTVRLAFATSERTSL